MNVYQNTTGMDRDSHIRAIAYSMWEEEGRPEGRAETHWLTACQLVDAADGAAQATLEPEWLKRTEAETAVEAEASPAEEPQPEAATMQLTEALRRLRKSQAA